MGRNSILIVTNTESVRFYIPHLSSSHLVHREVCEYCELSSSHGGECVAQNRMGCTAVFLIECRPTFQRYVLPPSSGR
jgi:hypothetical protein